MQIDSTAPPGNIQMYRLNRCLLLRTPTGQYSESVAASPAGNTLEIWIHLQEMSGEVKDRRSSTGGWKWATGDIIVGSNAVKILILLPTPANAADGDCARFWSILANGGKWRGRTMPGKIGTAKLRKVVRLEPLREQF